MKVLITGSSKLAGAVIKNLNGEIVYSKLDVETCRVESDIPWNHFDIFINNAHVGFKQAELLHEAYCQWKDDTDKLIINISSRAGKANISKGYLYAAQKAGLNHLADNLNYNSDRKCGIITLNLGLIEHDELPSLYYDEITDAIRELIFNWYTNRIVPTEMTLEHRANYREVQHEKQELKELEEYYNHMLEVEEEFGDKDT